ncbi:MAG TPA: hypothetical protein VJK66_00930 [Gaiellaceae bacterium]|nr:hypothetical protein [Gaiellaceae bacterium]
MSTYERLAALELELEGYDLERRSQEVSSGFMRVTTTIVLQGRDAEGRGEDVVYDAADHDTHALPRLVGRFTLDGFSRALDGVELSSSPLLRTSSYDYRRWAYESAALDLALRQGGVSLGEALGREYRPVRFVVSTRLDPRDWLAVNPALEFKLDPVSEWDRAHMEALAATERVRCLDLKSYYENIAVGQAPDARLYRDCSELFPDAVIEDAALTTETRDALRGAENRLSWDAPIHSVADVEALPIPPRWLNVKPSRFGTLRRLLDCLDWCAERGVQTYGGGQFELGVGRGQIQALASLFYAGAPNDVAPSEYNAPEPLPGLPRSPLAPPARPAGFSF